MQTSPKLSIFLPFLFLLLAGEACLAEIKVNKTCSDGSGKGSNFFFQADRISISVGSFDQNDLVVDLIALYPSSAITCSLSAMAGTYVRVVIPRVITSSQGLEAWGTMEFYTNATQGGDGSWRLFSLTVTIANNITGESYVKKLTPEEVNSLGLEGISLSKGYKCPSSHMRLGKSNSVDIENMRLFPFAKLGREPNDDDYVECVNGGGEGGHGMPWWGVALIIFGVMVVVGGVATGGFAFYRSRRGE